MKHLILLVTALLAVATGAKADVEINSTNFPDANFHNYLLSQSYGKDGKLTDSEIAGITELNVAAKGIESLRGIKYFTAVKMLKIYRNSINENEMEHVVRELPEQSGATLLAYYFGASDEKNYMNTLQVSAAQGKGWTAMMIQNLGTGDYQFPLNPFPPTNLVVPINEETFPDKWFRRALLEQGAGNFCGSQPYLTTEDVENTKKLVIVKGVTSLKGIEFFTALERLDCYKNQLTALDVSQNTALKELHCEHNRLTALDVSKNTKLYDLSCYNNQIKGTDMDNLIASLTENKTNYAHEFYVVSIDDDEGNICTMQQVQAVEARHWTPYWYNGTAIVIFGGDIEINSQYFPDANFRNYVSSSLDTNHNGYLSPAERDVTRLNVSNMNIESLKGIEYFENLEQLSCQFNRLETVDLSYNTKLKSLSIYNNQLTALDLSENTLLENLYCYENKLTTLDLSKNRKLWAVNIANNLIREEGMDNLVDNLPNVDPVIDENGYVETASLYAMNSETLTGNFISKAQVARARAKGWTVYHVVEYEGNSSWEEYDGDDPVIAINATNFPDEAFRNFLLEQDYGKDALLTATEISSITKLSVWGKHITSLKGIEYFTALEYLDCDYNQLTALDVSKNTALNELHCSSNNLTALDVSKNTKLIELCCSKNQLTALDVSKNTALTYLSCYNNRLSALDVSKNTALTYLDCSSNRLTALDVSKNTALKRFFCDNNRLTALDVLKNTELWYLTCYNNNIKGTRMDNLIAGLPENNNKRTFTVVSEVNEGNVCTRQQVQAAKARRWTPYYHVYNTDNQTEDFPYNGPKPRMGDVNDDNSVDVADISTVIDVMAGKASEYEDYADVNDDNSIDVADIATIIDIMAGRGDNAPETVTYTVNGVSFTMIGVEGGTFQMGSNDGDDNEKPVHQVTLSSFSIGQTEVTQELWEAVMGSNPANFKGQRKPVEKVTWDDCQTFIAMLGVWTGLSFRLPTEAEWEFAARGGNKSKGYKYSGSNTIDDVAWYGSNSNRTTHDVATKQANELGLYDMSGNVWEWCSDWYGDYTSDAQTNPTGAASGYDRACRGGSWGYPAIDCRVTSRGGYTPSTDTYFLGLHLGLRLVLSSSSK